MGSGIDSQSGLDSTSSLEVALDQAIARRFSSVHDRGSSKKRRNTPAQNFAVVAASKVEQAHTPTENLRGRPTTTALAVTSGESSLMRPPSRLLWKGIEVSDEFQQYAARVARGEELAPYRGPVLSRPCAEFPWSGAPREHQMLPPERVSLPPGRISLPPERASLLPQRSSLAPMAVSLFDSPGSLPPVYPERGRALKTTLWLAGAVSSIIAALGVGAGATNTAGNEFDEFAPDPGQLAQKPALAAARDEGLLTKIDDAPTLEASIGERQLDSLAATSPGPNPTPAAIAPARSLTSPLSAAPIAARPAPAPARGAAISASPTLPVTASTLGSSAPASRLSIPPSGPVPAAGELARGVVTSARPTGGDGIPSSHEGSLFSDRPSF